MLRWRIKELAESTRWPTRAGLLERAVAMPDMSENRRLGTPLPSNRSSSTSASNGDRSHNKSHNPRTGELRTLWDAGRLRQCAYDLCFILEQAHRSSRPRDSPPKESVSPHGFPLCGSGTLTSLMSCSLYLRLSRLADRPNHRLLNPPRQTANPPRLKNSAKGRENPQRQLYNNQQRRN